MTEREPDALLRELDDLASRHDGCAHGGAVGRAAERIRADAERIAELESAEEIVAFLRSELDRLPCAHDGSPGHLGTGTAPMFWPEAIACALQWARADGRKDVLEKARWAETNGYPEPPSKSEAP